MKKKLSAEKLKRRSFTCTDAEWAWLEQAAKSYGLSTAQLIRKIIKQVQKSS